MLDRIEHYARRPEPFAPGSSKFWDDEHISKGMLEAHLNPEWDAATRNHAFVDRSAAWIAHRLPPKKFPSLLDLGCGPGLYAERFHRHGYQVSGIDISKRSLDYARKSAAEKGYGIHYIHRSYLDLSITDAFDCAVMIYCDYSALSPVNRERLLCNVYRALKPGGYLLLDAFTPNQYKGRPESTQWSYHDGGFWKEGPHLCLESFCRYDDSHAFLRQTIVISEGAVDCYNIWDRAFEKEELIKELRAGGFCEIEICADVTGAEFCSDSPTLCAIAGKAG